MGDLKLGTIIPSALYIGANSVSKVYYFAELIWPPQVITRIFFNGGFSATAIALGTANTTANTVSTTETSGKNYAAFWQALLDNDSTAADARARLEETTVRQEFNLESQDATDQHSVGGLFTYAGGSNKTFSLTAQEESAITSEIQDYSTMVLELKDFDKANTSAASTTTTSATNQVKSRVTITSPGDYLIIGSASLSTSAITGAQTVRITDGTSDYGILPDIYAQDTTNYVPYWHVQRLIGLTNENIDLEFASDGTRTLDIRQASLLALNLADFENVYYAEQQTEQTTTTTTAWNGTGLTNTFNIVNTGNYHILLASAMISASATNRTVRARLFNTSTSVDYSGEHTREPNDTAEFYPTVVSRIVTFTQASNTIEWEFYISGVGTAQIKNMSITILDTGIPI